MLRSKLVNGFLIHKKREGCGDGFINLCKISLSVFFEFCEGINKSPLDITSADAKAFKEYLMSKEITDTTVNGYISSIRVFYNYLVLVERIIGNPFLFLTLLRVIPTDPPYVPIGKIKRMFAMLEAGFFAPLVHLAIFECLYGTGITAIELMNLRADDFNKDSESITVRGTLKRKTREVPLPAQSIYILKNYINYRKLHFPLSSYLVTNRRGKKLTHSAILNAVKGMLNLTGVEKKWTCTVKNSYRKHLLKAGVRMEDVGQLTDRKTSSLIKYYNDEIITMPYLRAVYNLAHPKA